jgi:hypothetical protein
MASAFNIEILEIFQMKALLKIVEAPWLLEGLKWNSDVGVRKI